MLDTAPREVSAAHALAASNARKVYVRGSRHDVRVPFREVALTPTEAAAATRRIAPLRHERSLHRSPT